MQIIFARSLTHKALTPAPGAYKPEGVKPQKEARAPAYSMGARTETRGQDNTPAPTCYNVGNTVGSKTTTLQSSPSHSMGARAKMGTFFAIFICLFIVFYWLKNTSEFVRNFLKFGPKSRVWCWGVMVHGWSCGVMLCACSRVVCACS